MLIAPRMIRQILMNKDDRTRMTEQQILAVKLGLCVTCGNAPFRDENFECPKCAGKNLKIKHAFDSWKVEKQQ